MNNTSGLSVQTSGRVLVSCLGCPIGESGDQRRKLHFQCASPQKPPILDRVNCYGKPNVLFTSVEDTKSMDDVWPPPPGKIKSIVTVRGQRDMET